MKKTSTPIWQQMLKIRRQDQCAIKNKYRNVLKKTENLTKYKKVKIENTTKNRDLWQKQKAQSLPEKPCKNRKDLPKEMNYRTISFQETLKSNEQVCHINSPGDVCL